jgi:hypothetical protein
MAFSPIFLWIFVGLDNAVGLPQKAVSQSKFAFTASAMVGLAAATVAMSMNAMWLTA